MEKEENHRLVYFRSQMGQMAQRQGLMSLDTHHMDGGEKLVICKTVDPAGKDIEFKKDVECITIYKTSLFKDVDGTVHNTDLQTVDYGNTFPKKLMNMCISNLIS